MEKVKDLLDPQRDDLQIRETKERGIFVEDMVEVSCSSSAEILKVFHTGTANRSVGSTKMNATSSRSHSLLCI